MMIIFSGINSSKHVLRSLTLVTANLVIPGVILISFGADEELSFRRFYHCWTWILQQKQLQSQRPPHLTQQMSLCLLDDTAHCLPPQKPAHLNRYTALFPVPHFCQKHDPEIGFTVNLLLISACGKLYMCTLQVKWPLKWVNSHHISGWPSLLASFCAGILENYAKWESPWCQCTYDFRFGSNYCFIIILL